ncbi:hypothetical protein CEP52_014627 [Fusarium oligoseptatum]|uniref:ZZ-type domain-containing protein n=1 Tax=Fusarium oligoseptatum TaxID=2604345 RepID=A0A428SKK3_9HYPO|nr:hypothetical protein CEP52_014627 [Fusarium oligoseptatum]
MEDSEPLLLAVCGIGRGSAQGSLLQDQEPTPKLFSDYHDKIFDPSAIHEIALKFLDFALEHFKDNEQRPIICLACDLGGSILKKALIIAEEEEGDNNHQLLRSISTLVFFGTPHQETPAEPWETTLLHLIIHLWHPDPSQISEWLRGGISTLAAEHRRVCRRFSPISNRYRVLQYTQDAVSPNLIFPPLLARLNCAVEETIVVNAEYDDLTQLSDRVHRDRYSNIQKEAMQATISEYRSLLQVFRIFASLPCDLMSREALFSKTASAIIAEHPLQSWLESDASEPMALEVLPAFKNDDFLYSLASSMSNIRQDGYSKYLVLTANMAQLGHNPRVNKSVALLCSLLHQALQCYPLFWHKLQQLFSYDVFVSTFSGASVCLLEPMLWRCFMAFLSMSKPIACVVLADELECSLTAPEPFLKRMIALVTSVDCTFKLLIVHDNGAATAFKKPTMKSTLDVSNSHIQESIEADAMRSLDISNPDLDAIRLSIREILPAAYSDPLRLACFIRHLQAPGVLKRQRLVDGLRLLSAPDELVPTVLQHTPDSEKKNVRDSLLIVAHALRPLTLLELGAAIATGAREEETQSTPCQRSLPIDTHHDLLDYFASLVRTERDSIQLVHSTVRNLLDENQSTFNPWYRPQTHPQLGMTKLCLQCIEMSLQPQDRGGRLDSDSEMADSQEDERLSPPVPTQPFLEYAVLNWPFHFSQALSASPDPASISHIVALLSDELVNEWLGLWVKLRCPAVHSSLQPSARLSPLELRDTYQIPLDSALMASVEALNSLVALDYSEDLAILWGVSKAVGVEAGAGMWNDDMHYVSKDPNILLRLFGIDPQLAFELLAAIDTGYIDRHLACVLSQDVHFGGHCVLEYILSQEPTQRIPLPQPCNRCSNVSLTDYSDPEVSNAPSLDGPMSAPMTLLSKLAMAEFLCVPTSYLEAFFKGPNVKFAAISIRAAVESGNVDAICGLAALRLDLDDAANISAVSLAANYGFITILEQLLPKVHPKDLNSPDASGSIPLHTAAHNGLPRVASALMRYGAGINIYDTNGATPLQAAVESGNLPVVRCLLGQTDEQQKVVDTVGHRANTLEMINQPNDEGLTPLMSALTNSSQSIARLIWQQGPKLDVMDSSGHGPMYFAAKAGYLDLLEEILTCNQDIEAGLKIEALDIAADMGHASCVSILRTLGAPGNIANLLVRAIRDGQDEVVKALLCHEYNIEELGEPLHYAAIDGRVEMCNLLLDSGADKDYQDSTGNTALGLAAYYDESSAVEVLLLRRADLEQKDTRDFKKTSKLLTDAGAKVTTEDKDGLTPLDLADSHGGDLFQLLWKAWLRSLLSSDKPAEMRSLLERAISHELSNLAEELLREGADVWPNDLSNAMEKRNTRLVSMLLKHGADPNSVATEGLALPIHNAAFWCDLDLAKELLKSDNKADVNLKGGCWRSALHACLESQESDDEKKQKDLTRPGETILHYALQFAPGLVEHLLEKHSGKLPLNEKDQEGRLPAHFAASQGSSSLALDELLKPEFNVPDYQGRLPIHLVAAGGSVKAMENIIKRADKGAQLLCEQDIDGWNVLHWACRQGDLVVVKWILDQVSENGHPLPLSTATTQGWLPFDVARNHGNEHFGRILPPAPQQKESDEDIWQQTTASCDSCFCRIYGKQYKCLDCDDFDLCFKCYGHVGKIHDKDHEFQTLSF